MGRRSRPNGGIEVGRTGAGRSERSTFTATIGLGGGPAGPGPVGVAGVADGADATNGGRGCELAFSPTTNKSILLPGARKNQFAWVCLLRCQRVSDRKRPSTAMG